MLTEGSQASICSPESGFQLLFASSRKAELYYMGSDGRQTQPGLGGGRARASPQVMPPWTSPARAWRWFSLEGLKRKRLFLLKKINSLIPLATVWEKEIFSKLLCVPEVPQASLRCSQRDFTSHTSCVGREQVWLDPSPSQPFPRAEMGYNGDITTFVVAGG